VFSERGPSLYLVGLISSAQATCGHRMGVEVCPWTRLLPINVGVEREREDQKQKRRSVATRTGRLRSRPCAAALRRNIPSLYKATAISRACVGAAN
jgi:hypothetical protein